MPLGWLSYLTVCLPLLVVTAIHLKQNAQVSYRYSYSFIVSPPGNFHDFLETTVTISMKLDRKQYCGWLYFRGYQFSWIERKWHINGVQNSWLWYFHSYRKSLIRGYWNLWIRRSTKIGTPQKLSHPQYPCSSTTLWQFQSILSTSFGTPYMYFCKCSFLSQALTLLFA